MTQNPETEQLNFFNGKSAYKTTPTPATTTPGDVLHFGYRDLQGQEGNHLVLVLGNERTTSGVFKGQRGHYLSGVKLNGLSTTIMNLILENLYNNRTSTYSSTVKQGLLAVVGKSNYRTYIVSSMFGCMGV